MSISKKSVRYKAMEEDYSWNMLGHLLGGTKTMRDQGTTYLPKEPKEAVLAYRNRLARSFLINFFESTINKHAEKPFRQPVQLSDNLPDRLKPLEYNMDGVGTALTAQAKYAFKMAEELGMFHLYVDFPNTDATTNLDTERRNASKLRPLVTVISPRDVIFWDYTTDPTTGVYELSEIRIKERMVVRTADGNDDTKEFIRVLTKQDGVVSWELWEDVSKYSNIEDWRVSTDTDGNPVSGTLTIDEIPIRTCYFGYIGPMMARPPLLNLAWLNIQHWQSYSDQSNILRFARCGTYVFSGFSADAVEDFSPGPNSVISSHDAEANAHILEYSGNSIAAGRDHLQDLRAEMQVEGSRPLVQRATNYETATGKRIDSSDNDCVINAWVVNTEQAFEEAFRLAAKWVGLELPEDFSIDIYNDFNADKATVDESRLILDMYDRDLVTAEVVLDEFKRRNVLNEKVDKEEMLANLEAGSLALPKINNNNNNGNGENLRMDEQGSNNGRTTGQVS